MKKKFSVVFLCLAFIICAFSFAGCKTKLNWPEVWYIHVSLNGGHYSENNPYGWSPSSNVLKPVGKDNFKNFSMPEAEYIDAPQGKVFAGWYFDNIENDFANNWTETNWYSACENAKKEEKGKRSVVVYAKWIDEGDAIIVLNGGKQGTLKSPIIQKISMSNYDSAVATLPTSENINNILTYPVGYSFEGWYLHVGLYEGDYDIDLVKTNVETQINDSKSAYVELFAKWAEKRVVVFEINAIENLDETYKNDVHFTNEYFETREKGEKVAGMDEQTDQLMVVCYYYDELISLNNEQFLSKFPTMANMNISNGFNNSFDELYFLDWDGTKEVYRQLNKTNVINFIDNKQYKFNKENLYIYLAWDFDVTFDLNYDGAPDPEIKATKPYTLVEAPSTPTREGYTFVGWSTENWDTPTMYYPFDITTKLITRNITLYAVWQEE